jgi:hypothetical protein
MPEYAGSVFAVTKYAEQTYGQDSKLLSRFWLIITLKQ